MNIRRHGTRTIVRALALGLSVAAVSVPVAQADPYDRGIVPTPASRSATVDLTTLDPLVADAIRAEQASRELDPLIADAIRAEQASSEVDPLIGDAIRAAENLSTNLDSSSLSRAATQSSFQGTRSTADGFQWRDAGVGAVSLLVLILLGAAGTLVVHRHRGRPAAF
jgi:hypothetical protein